MRTIHDWLKYVEDSKRHAPRSERSAPPRATVPAQPIPPVRPPVPQPSAPSRKEAPPPTERQAPPPVRVRRGSQPLPPSVRPIETEAPPQPTRRRTQSPTRMRELMASIDTALQVPLPLPSPPRESVSRRRKRSPFSESRETLVRRLVDPELRLREVALLLSVCPATVRRYANRGILTSYRTVGNQRRFRLSEVVDFVHGRRTRSAGLASPIPIILDGSGPPEPTAGPPAQVEG